jgi:hypothetical protein
MAASTEKAAARKNSSISLSQKTVIASNEKQQDKRKNGLTPDRATGQQKWGHPGGQPHFLHTSPSGYPH